MFIVLVSYQKTIEDIDKHLEAHRAFLKEHYAAGDFLASGPQNPRTGGVIFAKSNSKEALLEILERDPFKIHNIATYKVIEFLPNTTVEQLAYLKTV